MRPQTTTKKTVAETFDPKVLDSTMVAIPLLRAITDVEEAQSWMKDHPKLRKENFNAVIFFRRDYPGGIRAAQGQVEDMLEKILSQLDALSNHNRLLQEAPTAREKRTFTVAFLERRARIALSDRDRKQEFRAIDRLRPVYFDIIIDVNLNYPAGRKEARKWIISALRDILPGSADETEAALKEKGDAGDQYVFARMRAEHISALLEQDSARSKALADELNAVRLREQDGRGGARDAEVPIRSGSCRAIHGIWPDFPIKPCITDSIATVKADAALSCFSTMGDDITWAVIDSGIAAEHPHFDLHHNIDSTSPLHRDFTKDVIGTGTSLQDVFGHGTHVAGIIAGEYDSGLRKDKQMLNAVRRCRVRPTEQESDVEKIRTPIGHIRGMAPKCQLVSLKVLDDVGYGEVSNVIAALSYILDLNNSGRSELKIHGVNISLGYEFEPEWFACGESPICMEVNRVVRSGVPVVVAAGNTGYGTVTSRERSTAVGLDLTINDPGNAEFAITVGSTHRDMPHRYGVSFFSSKGPTGDGRPKPDLVAPGEKILSCAAGALLQDRAPGEKDFRNSDGVHYVEDSGTSMAAPHVSGIIAGLLSVRREFIGKPEQVKEILCTTATDLKRDRYFQGAGLVDLMRSIQSI
jgi:hypothetical protein